MATPRKSRLSLLQILLLVAAAGVLLLTGVSFLADRATQDPLSQEPESAGAERALE